MACLAFLYFMLYPIDVGVHLPGLSAFPHISDETVNRS